MNKKFEELITVNQEKIDFVKKVMQTSVIPDAPDIDEYYNLAVEDECIKALLQMPNESVDYAIDDIIHNQECSEELISALNEAKYILMHSGFPILSFIQEFALTIHDFEFNTKFETYLGSDKELMKLLDNSLVTEVEPGVFLRTVVFLLEFLSNAFEVAKTSVGPTDGEFKMDQVIGSHTFTFGKNSKDEAFVVYINVNK